MAAIDLLKEQHRETERLLEQIKRSSGTEKVLLLGRLAEAITLHATLEERFFYPMLSSNGFQADVQRSVNEHAQVRRMLSELLSMKKSDPRLDSVVARVESAVMKHVQEEENDIFQRARERIPAEELDRVGAQMRDGMSALQEGELLEAADEEQVPAP